MKEEQRLKQFPLGEHIRIPTHVILHRGSISPQGLGDIREAGVYRPGPEGNVCELVAGGTMIAQGRLMKRRGMWYMRVEKKGDNE